MKIFLVVHGFVQGVGYRHLVSRAARKIGVMGMVRNSRDGSVEIFAEAESSLLKMFEEEIKVVIPNGPQVLNIERHEEGSSNFPKYARTYKEFVVEKDE